MTEQYNFREECLKTYDQSIYNQFMDFFDSLPLACVVNKSFFCVHGGISDKTATVPLFPYPSWLKSTVSKDCAKSQ